MEKIPETQYKIRFIDCDPLGHLTNSRFIDYMLNAREDHVNKFYHLDYLQESQKTGCSWVTLQNQIAYIKEVRYGDEVTISSKLIEFSEKRGTVEIQLKNAKTQRINALLWTEVIYFDLKTRKSTAQPPYILEMFEQVLVDIPEKDFSSRLKTLLEER